MQMCLSECIEAAARALQGSIFVTAAWWFGVFSYEALSLIQKFRYSWASCCIFAISGARSVSVKLHAVPNAFNYVFRSEKLSMHDQFNKLGSWDSKIRLVIQSSLMQVLYVVFVCSVYSYTYYIHIDFVAILFFAKIERTL